LEYLALTAGSYNLDCQIMIAPAVLQLTNIMKRFAGTQALDGVSLAIRPGEIHALLGENGAGKSTLIKILAGIYTADSGQVQINGIDANPRRDRLPIAFIHQDLGLVETMTVAENIALVAGYPSQRGLISWSATRNRALDSLARLGATTDPLVKVGDLPPAERSIVAIARALATKCDLVVLDEPTAALPEPDVAKLLETLRALARHGVAILYVSHRLDEVFRIADRTTVLRDGRVVGSVDVRDTTPEKLVNLIIGRSLSEMFTEPPPSDTQTLLEVRDLQVGFVGPVSFSIRRGEVVGLAGLRGAGHLSIGRAIYGATDKSSGSVTIDGRKILTAKPADAIRARIGLVPNRRREEGLANGLSVAENLFLNPRASGVRWNELYNSRSERNRARERLKPLAVRPSDPGLIISALSGGNQQKVVLARWFAIGARVLILEEPTLGVDVGAKADVYKLITSALREGHAILLISSDFEEVSGICHRALIFDRGRISAELPRDQLSVSGITSIASGGSDAKTETRVQN
jgi:ribose transport system ATP-binding protein